MTMRHILQRFEQRLERKCPPQFIGWAKKEIIEGRAVRVDGYRMDNKHVYKVRYMDLWVKLLWDPVARVVLTIKPPREKAGGSFTLSQITGRT